MGEHERGAVVPGSEDYYRELAARAESGALQVRGPVRRVTAQDRARIHEMLLEAVADDPENAALLARVLDTP